MQPEKHINEIENVELILLIRFSINLSYIPYENNWRYLIIRRCQRRC